MRGLYAITPDLADTEALLRKVEEALKAGVAMLQYRNKIISKDKRLLQAKELAPLARGYGVPFVVDDDVELALAVGANGAHLGNEDGDLAAARREVGRTIGPIGDDRDPASRQLVEAHLTHSVTRIRPRATVTQAWRAATTRESPDLRSVRIITPTSAR